MQSPAMEALTPELHALTPQRVATLVESMLKDSRHGWSLGIFGAIGEFLRNDEPATLTRCGDTCEITTEHGGMRVSAHPALRLIAYDTLSSDGETWSHALAFCLPQPERLGQQGVQPLGADQEAIRPDDADMQLFDIGVGLGHVRFCVRTRDPMLIAALAAIQGQSALSPAAHDAMAALLRVQPHRALLSPVGRIEVYSQIPQPDGQTPEGPHTHLLPKLLVTGRTHPATAPIPADLQPVLMLHPRSPWRDELGRRVDYDASLDEEFLEIMGMYGLVEDSEISQSVTQAVLSGVSPESFLWPATRRGHIKARITLRRLANAGCQVDAWRRRYDRTGEEVVEGVGVGSC